MRCRGCAVPAKVIFVFLVLVFLQSEAAASGVIKGTVIDFATKEPVSGANIYFPELNIGVVSGRDGSFEIRLETPVNAFLEVSFIGYEPKKIPIVLKDNETKEITVYLDPGSLKLDEVRVFGDRVKQTIFKSSSFVSVKFEEEFVKIDKKTTADLLREEPGILIQKTTHAHGAPIIRGLIGKYVLLMFNGIRLNKPTFRLGGNQYMNTVSAEGLNRIEIVRGPTSVLYGSDAIGGTINLVSEQYESLGPELKFFPSMQLGYSSADNSSNVSLFFRGSKNIVSFSSSLSYKNFNDLKPGDGQAAQEPTGWKELDGSLNVYIEPSPENRIALFYINVNQDDVPRYDKYETGEFEQWLYDPQKRQLYALNYTYTPPLSWLHHVTFSVSYQNEHEGRTQQKAGSSKVIYDDDKISTKGIFVQFSSIARNKHWLNWGAEFYRDEIGSSRINTENGIETPDRGAYPDNSVYDSFGAYFQENYIRGEKLDLGLGLRFSRFRYESPLEAPWGDFEDSFSDFTGSASVSYGANEVLNIVGSVARGFRAPNFNDTVVLTYSNSGVDAPSPGLSPEKSSNIELGLKLDAEKAKGGAFVYYNRMTDLIDRRLGTYADEKVFDENKDGIYDPGEPPIFQKFNVGKADIYGAELHGSYRFDPFTVSGHVFYTFGENITSDEPMSRIPPLMGKLGLQWYPGEKLWMEAYSRFAAKQDRLSERDILDSRIPDRGTAGYLTLNFRTIYSMGANKIIFRFDNILDELYKEHGSGIWSPGRSFSFMVQYAPNGRGK